MNKDESVQPTGGSRFAQSAFECQRRLPPVADAFRWPSPMCERREPKLNALKGLQHISPGRDLRLPRRSPTKAGGRCPGLRSHHDFLSFFFRFGAPGPRQTGGKKRDWLGGCFTRGRALTRLPRAGMRLPFQGAGRANKSHQPTPGARLGFNWERVVRRGCALR